MDGLSKGASSVPKSVLCLVTLIAYLPNTLVGSLEENPLAVKLLNNGLYMLALVSGMLSSN